MTAPDAARSGASLLETMMSETICIHDDWNEILGADDWDQFDTNPMLLGAHTCVMHEPIGFGDRYVEMLGRLECLPRQVIRPKRRSRSVTRDLLLDVAALDAFRAALEVKKAVSTYYSYHDLGVEKLMERADGHARCIPPIEGFNRLIDRSTSHLLMRKAGVPTPVAEVCANGADVSRFLRSANRIGFAAVILKDHHRKTYPIRTPGDLAQIEMDVSFPALVECVYRVASSPVCQSVSYGGQTAHLFTLNQTISGFAYKGNSSPLVADQSVNDRIKLFNESIIREMSPYEGVIGVDYIVTLAGEIFAVDLNPRFNSSTYPYVFLERMGLSVARSHTRFRVIADCPVADLSHLLEAVDFPAFDRDRRSGVFVFNPVPDAAGRHVSKWSAISVSETKDGLDAIEAAFSACLARMRSAHPAVAALGTACL